MDDCPNFMHKIMSSELTLILQELSVLASLKTSAQDHFKNQCKLSEIIKKIIESKREESFIPLYNLQLILLCAVWYLISKILVTMALQVV